MKLSAIFHHLRSSPLLVERGLLQRISQSLILRVLHDHTQSSDHRQLGLFHLDDGQSCLLLDQQVKVVDQGETEIYQVTEKGEENGRWDDVMKYEMTRGFGVGVQLGRYFGMWTLPA